MTTGTRAAASFPGGRRAAEARLAAIDQARYGASRNHLDGAVTRLSPYIRHGVLSLAEVRDAVFAQLQAPGGGGRAAGEKLINELGWRDYWQRLWQQLGSGIWRDQEELKTGHHPGAYGAELPADVAEGRTGLACMDGFIAELHSSGWLHNHARMWLAAYLVHWRRIRWQAGAQWFLRHLLDGDPASNNLSWQWVASSFSQKPYLFNRDNLERFSSGSYCQGCPKAEAGCPFEGSYESLEARLFRPHDPRADSSIPLPPAATPPRPESSGPTPLRPMVWVHGEALGPANPALRAHPGAPAVFVFDHDLISGLTATTGGHGEAGPAPLASGRLQFLRDCLTELTVEVRQGAVAEELLAAAAIHGCDGIVTSRAVDPRFSRIASRLAQTLPLRILDPEPFVALPVLGPGTPDLGRFNRYWRRAEPLVWGETTTVSDRKKNRRRR